MELLATYINNFTGLSLTSSQLYEILSLIASILTAISLTVKSLYKMRWLNMFGCIGFTIYGVLIKAWPLAIVNAYIAVIDILGIIKLKNTDKSTFYFGKLGDIGEKYFEQFYQFYEDDIRSFFPDVKYGDLEIADTYVLFRDMIPVGIFSIKKNEDTAELLMDYVVPRYRDGQFGYIMYSKKAYVFRDLGIRKFETKTKIKSHSDYLKKMGFVVVKDGNPEDNNIHLVKDLMN
jgi:hypothetical protein